MKIIFWCLCVCFGALSLIAGRIIDDQAKRVLQTLKLADSDAHNIIFSNISSPSFYFPNIKELKSIASRERAATVNVIGKYVKEFAASEDFVNRYNQYRETKKPNVPEKPKSAAEMKQEHIDNMKKSIEELKVTKSQMPADQQEMFDETILTMEEQLKELEDPNNPMYSPEMDAMMQQGYDQQMQMYNDEIAKWQTKYPENNPKPILKIWLEEFLNQTKDVNFNAQTAVDEKNRTIFTKQEYERKNYLWKLCFRGGKETTEAAQQFAQNWLKEL